MPEALEQLIDSLLYEGYALYPYTPGASKNATPTPFGIAYPPAYAATLASTFEHLTLRCVLEASPRATISAEVRFLAASGHGHQAQAHRLELADTSLGALLGAASEKPQPIELYSTIDVSEAQPLTVMLSLQALQLEPGSHELMLRVENRTPVEPGIDRAAELGRSLLSTHPILRVCGGRFISPLERPCASVNTFPVLASAADDTVIGAAIVLPDHPQIAPESRGGLFDSTEIEEALLLHVKVLSDSERAQIESQDPVVAEMVARAAAATPAEILALHGRVTLKDPEPGAARSRVSDSPPEEPAGLLDPHAGEDQAEVDGVLYRKGAKVRLRPGPDTDFHAQMLDGRVARIERIMIDYDGKMHLGVTIDGDPGQEILSDSGRFLYFFASEVEVLGASVAQTGGSNEL
jgi:hypothetical protein